jgi:hypothetical protein
MLDPQTVFLEIFPLLIQTNLQGNVTRLNHELANLFPAHKRRYFTVKTVTEVGAEVLSPVSCNYSTLT